MMIEVWIEERMGREEMRGQVKRGKAGGFNNRGGLPQPLRGNPGVVQGGFPDSFRESTITLATYLSTT
jgi:hypothetical protein